MYRPKIRQNALPMQLSWENHSHSFEPHFHDQLFLGVILHGECEFSASGKTHLARKNDIVIIPPFMTHSARCSKNTRYFGFYLDEQEFISRTASQAKYLHTHQTNLAVTHAGLAAKEVVDSIITQKNSKLEKLLPEIFGANSYLISQTNHENQKSLSLLCRFIEKSKDNLPINEIAQSLHLHPEKFSRLFHRSLGMRAVYFRNQIRILLAEQQIIDKERISIVAANRGYADQAHMTREFRKFRGVTPGTYLTKYEPIPMNTVVNQDGDSYIWRHTEPSIYRPNQSMKD